MIETSHAYARRMMGFPPTLSSGAVPQEAADDVPDAKASTPVPHLDRAEPTR